MYTRVFICCFTSKHSTDIMQLQFMVCVSKCVSVCVWVCVREGVCVCVYVCVAVIC